MKKTFVTASILMLASVSSALGKGPPRPPAAVAVSPIVQQQVASEQTFVGTLMPVRTSSVGSAVDGRVLEFPVNEGDRVQKGETIAQLLTGQLDIELAGARAQLDAYQARLAELRTGLRKEEREQAEAQMLSRKALYEYSGSRLKRVQRLAESGTSTQDELQDATSVADQARHAYVDARLAYELAMKGPREEQIAQAEAQVRIQTEEVNRILDQLEKHTIRAPFNGYIIEEHTEVGQWVAKAGLVAKIVELDEVDVEVQVPENYLTYLQPKMPIRVEVSALPREVFLGEISRIVPQADVRGRSFPVKVRLKNRFRGETPLLSPGMFARVALPVGTPAEATMTHKDSIVLGGVTPVVYVVDREAASNPQGKVRAVPVTMGAAAGNWIAIKGDVKPGEQVVVEGNERLRAGQLVSVVSVRDQPVAPAAAETRQAARSGS